MNYYDRNGDSITFDRFCKLQNDESYCVLARTSVPGQTEVSTVWLGLSGHPPGTRPPIIFETLVFGPSDRVLESNRYSTEESAMAGHKELVIKFGGTP